MRALYFGIVAIRSRLDLKRMGDICRRCIDGPRPIWRSRARKSGRRPLAIQECIFALQVGALCGVALLVSRAEVSSHKVAIATWKVTAVDLLGRVYVSSWSVFASCFIFGT